MICYHYYMKLAGKLTQIINGKIAALVGITVSVGAFLALTITRLTGSSIWFDESYSAYLMRYNFADLTHYTAVDVHPPFYYYLLKIWTSIFDSSIASIRSMSVFGGVIALILLFILIKKLFNQKSALLATFLVAISPMFVRYGIEARMYMTVAAIVLAACLVYLQALKTNRWRDWLIYGLLVCLGMYTHYFTITIWLTLWLHRFIYLYSQRQRGWRLIKNYFSRKWLLAHILAIALFLPWIPIAYSQFTGVSQGFWIPAVTINTPGDMWADIMMYLEGWRADGWLSVALLLAFILILGNIIATYRHSDNNKQRGIVFLATVALCPIILLMVLSSYPFKSVFVDRYLMPSVITAVALIGVAIAYNKNKLVSGITLALVLACFSYGIYNVYHYGNYNRYGHGDDKVTLTGDLINKIQQYGQSGIPIISISSYGYYEAAAYDSPAHPVYYLYSDVKDSNIGSLQMLRDNKFNRAIKNVDQFTHKYDYVWLVGSTKDENVAVPTDGDQSDWQKIKTISLTDPISGVNYYKATLYKIKHSK